ncbi:MAG: winged helix-turn-helix transcriptional regulator [Candidatus Binatia bacterium]
MTQSYGQFCPVAMSAEVVAERWTLLVIRNILCGAHTFNDIQRGVPLMSRSLLSKRLKQLEKAGVIERRPGRRSHTYHVTEAGQELLPLIEQLGAWGQRWVRSEIDPGPLDPRLLMWDMQRRIHTDRLPDRRVVVRFEFTDVRRLPLKRTWLVLDRLEIDVCYKDPGFPVDVVVTTSLRTLTQAWMGDIPFAPLLRSGEIEVDGPRELVRGFPGWLALSSFADVERPRAAARA